MAPRTRSTKPADKPADTQLDVGYKSCGHPEYRNTDAGPQPNNCGCDDRDALVDGDWDTLPEPVAMPAKVTQDDIKVNVVKSVPAPIRMRAEASLAINAEKVAKKSGSTSARKRVDYDWRVQRVASEKMGADFKRLVVKYAKYRPSEGDIPFKAENSPLGQVTARAGAPTWFVLNDDGTYTEASQTDDGAFLGVRYSVRPFEARGDTSRVPGTA